MAKVHSLIYCEAIENRQMGVDNKLVIVLPLIRIRPAFLPTNYSFGINVNIENVNAQKPHTMQIIFKSPDNEVIIDTGRNPLPIINELPNGGDPETADLSLALEMRNVLMINKGTYNSVVIFDDVILGEFPIEVDVLKQNGK